MDDLIEISIVSNDKAVIAEIKETFPELDVEIERSIGGLADTINFIMGAAGLAVSVYALILQLIDKGRALEVRRFSVQKDGKRTEYSAEGVSAEQFSVLVKEHRD